MLKATAKEAERRQRQLAQRNELILKHMPLVRTIALHLHDRVPAYVEVDDLVHSGILGLIDAAAKYDATKQVDFRHYAKHRIRGAMLDSLRQMDWASRDFRRRQKEASEAVRVLTMTLQREPTEAEIAARLGVPVEGWREMAAGLRAAGPISSSTAGQDAPPPHEATEDPEGLPDRLCAHEEMRSVLAEAMQQLPERHRMVLTLYYSRELTMREIGIAMGVNESRVSQIHKSALEKMAVVLRTRGIETGDAFELPRPAVGANGQWSIELPHAA